MQIDEESDIRRGNEVYETQGRFDNDRALVVGTTDLYDGTPEDVSSCNTVMPPHTIMP